MCCVIDDLRPFVLAIVWSICRVHAVHLSLLNARANLPSVLHLNFVPLNLDVVDSSYIRGNFSVDTQSTNGRDYHPISSNRLRMGTIFTFEMCHDYKYFACRGMAHRSRWSRDLLVEK